MSDTKNPTSPNYLEPQTLKGDMDKEFLSTLPLTKPDGDFYNFMIIGQDDRAGERKTKLSARTTGGQETAPSLASRSDIIMLVSINKREKTGTIFSIYRGNVVPSSCFNSTTAPMPAQPVARAAYSGFFGYTAAAPTSGDDGPMILADYYEAFGRKAFLPCIQRIFTERIGHLPDGSRYLPGGNGLIPIHALFEGGKSVTVTPVAKGAVGVVFSNWRPFAWAYGTSIGKLTSLVMDANKIKEIWSPEASQKESIDTGDLDQTVNGHALQRMLMERKSYIAGGYQRAYNVARFIGDLIGWVAVGLNYYPTLNLSFENVFDNLVSRTLLLKDFDQELRSGTTEHPFTWLGYTNGKPQYKLVQFGLTSNSYAILEHGEIRTRSGHEVSTLNADLQLLPAPPDLVPTAGAQVQK